MSAPALSPCGEIVRRGDRQRFLAAMTAPPDMRERLFALYAFNLELARIPAASREPLTGMIRLQWWRDALDELRAGKPPRRHEVVEPLAEAIRDAALPLRLFDRILDARAHDAARDWPQPPVLARYLRDTGGGLLMLAARTLHPGGADDAAEQAGFAFAARRWIDAQPMLARYGATPMTPQAVAALERDAQAALSAARGRPVPAAAAPAFREGWRSRAGLVLRAGLGGW